MRRDLHRCAAFETPGNDFFAQLLREARFGSEITSQDQLAELKIEVFFGFWRRPTIATGLVDHCINSLCEFIAEQPKNFRLLSWGSVNEIHLEEGLRACVDFAEPTQENRAVLVRIPVRQDVIDEKIHASLFRTGRPRARNNQLSHLADGGVLMRRKNLQQRCFCDVGMDLAARGEEGTRDDRKGRTDGEESQ